jgi:biopolymer transport protein ExbD
MVTPDLSALSSMALLVLVLFLSLGPLFARSLPVALPPVTMKLDTQLPPDQLIVRIRGEQLSLNDQPHTRQTLSDALRTALAGQKDAVVMLDADPSLPFNEVVFYLDVCYAAGARSVGLTDDLLSLAPAPAPIPSQGSPSTAPGSPAPGTEAAK